MGKSLHRDWQYNVACLLTGIGLPVIIYSPTATGFTMIAMEVLLTQIFVAIAMLAAVTTRVKAKGIALAIFLWLYFPLLFDELILFILFQFQDYPLEKVMIVASVFNPIDLGRILMLLKIECIGADGLYRCSVQRLFRNERGIGNSHNNIIIVDSYPFLAIPQEIQQEGFIGAGG